LAEFLEDHELKLRVKSVFIFTKIECKMFCPMLMYENIISRCKARIFFNHVEK